MNGKHIVLLIIALFAIVLVGATWQHAQAAECAQYDQVVAGIEAKGIHPFFIAPEKLPKTVEDLEAITGDTYGQAVVSYWRPTRCSYSGWRSAVAS